MFCVDSRFEIHIPPFFEGDGQTLQQFHLVEQCFNVPLWHIQVLPPATKPDDFQRWSCFLVARTVDAIGFLQGNQWEKAMLHVVLPMYMTRTDSIAMARCTAIWECLVEEQSGQVALVFDTNLGSFADPDVGLLETTSMKKIAAKWMDPEASSVGKHPQYRAV
jgi:hypothetical protein